MQCGDRAELHTKKMNSDLDLSSMELKDAWKSVRDPNSAINHCIFTYQENSKNKIICLKTGSGGFNEIFEGVTDNDILFYGVRVKLDGMEKFLFICFIGSDVSGIKKGRACMHQQGISNLMEGTMGDILLAGKEEVVYEVFIEKIKTLSKSETIVIQ